MVAKIYATDGNVTFAGYSQSWIWWNNGRKPGYSFHMGTLSRDGDPVFEGDVPACLIDELQRLAIEAATEGNALVKMREAIVAGTDILAELYRDAATCDAERFDCADEIAKAATERNHQMAEALAAIATAYDATNRTLADTKGPTQ